MVQSIHYLIIYIGVINFIAFFAMFIDKTNAIKHKWRISERTLLLMGLLGGNFGIISGMIIMKHKLSKARFRIGMPLVGTLYYFILVYVAFKG